MDQSALLDMLKALKAAEVGDRVRKATEKLDQEPIDAAATAVIGAGPWQRSSDRRVQRNGTLRSNADHECRGSGVAHPEVAGRVVLPVAAGTASAGDQALFAVVMEAYLHGVATRKVDDLVKALGAGSGIWKV